MSLRGFKNLKNRVFPLLYVPAGLKKFAKSCFSIFVCPCGAQKFWKIMFFYFCMSLRGSKNLKNRVFLFFVCPCGAQQKLKNYVFPSLSVPAGLKFEKLCFSIVCPCGAQKIWKIIFFHFCMSLRGSKNLKNCVFSIIRVVVWLKTPKTVDFWRVLALKPCSID